MYGLMVHLINKNGYQQHRLCVGVNDQDPKTLEQTIHQFHIAHQSVTNCGSVYIESEDQQFSLPRQARSYLGKLKEDYGGAVEEFTQFHTLTIRGSEQKQLVNKIMEEKSFEIYGEIHKLRA